MLEEKEQNKLKDENFGKDKQNIAVIAVHGVSDQRPFDSARQVANLLINPEFNLKSQYSSFSERFFRLPVTALGLQQKKGKDNYPEHKPLIPDERGEVINKRLNEPIDSQESKEAHKAEEIKSEIDIDLTQDYISEYKKSTVYDTIRLESKVTQKDIDKKVHVYEMYWADLSQLGTGFIRIFGELYQLLFHVASLGRPVVDLARISIREDNNLSIQTRKELDSIVMLWGRIQIWNGRILTIIIPISNILLLTAAFLSIPINNLPNNVLSIANLLILTIVGTVLVYYLTFSFFKQVGKQTLTSFWIRFISPFALGIILALLYQYAPKALFSEHINAWIAGEWLMILLGTIYFLLIKPYNKRRPGANKFAVIILAISILLYGLLYQFPISFSVEDITLLSLDLIELFYILTYISWFVFIFLYFITTCLGFYIQHSLKKLRLETIQQFNKALWITTISLCFPALLFLMLTVSLWSALNQIGSALIMDVAYSPRYMLGIQQHLINKGESCTSQSDCFLQALSDYSATPFAIIITVLLVMTLLIALWTLLPAVITEVFPPDSSKEKDPNSYSSINLGQWLTNGFKVTVTSITIFICFCVPLFFALGLILDLYYFFNLHYGLSLFSWLIDEQYLISQLDKLLESTVMIQKYSATIIAASAGSLVALGSRLNKISLGLRGVLDAALDVDNYLRLYPRDDNPRARIYARYFSLLNYICHWQDPTDKQKYDAIIIVSHSQGTVISADLLRFLEHNKNSLCTDLVNKELDIPYTYLFTMGSPLRQLYSFAFPHLYYWLYNSKEIDNKNKNNSVLDEKSNPNPEQLFRTKQWVNAYRSGDYIGRYIWRSPEDESLWNNVDLKTNSDVSESKDYTRREFCIGSGGHTHYWDETAPEIAFELDRLITDI